MPKIRVADYIVNFLKTKGVRKVFLLSGGGMMHLLDAISRNSEIGYICNHHEQASAMAAEAYARQSGGLGVCYATSGPGATNTITGIVGAWQDSSPVLFITGQSKLVQTIRHNGLYNLRQFGTFEVDIVPIVKTITKYAVFLDDPKKIRYHLEKAYDLAMNGRPGPVLIDIPIDIQAALIDPDELESYQPETQSTVTLSDTIISNILKRLRSAKRPLILAGHGIRVANTVSLFEELIEQLNIPVITTQLGKDVIEYDHPLFVGHPGTKGDRAGNFAVQNADVLLTLGCSLHVLTTGYELDKFAPQAYKIQVEPDENVLKREKVGVNEKIQSDIKIFIETMLSRSKGTLRRPKDGWHTQCQLWKYELDVQKEPHKKSVDTINYYEFVDALSYACVGNETIVSDAGSAFYIIGQAFRVKKGQRVIISGALGAMGFALPASTGASVAAPEKKIICITGDGSLQTNVHELATICHHQLNIKLFIINNNGYVSIQNTQNNFFNGQYAGVNEQSGVSFPNLKKLASAYNFPYLEIKSPDNLLNNIHEVLAMDGPILCEVFASPEQEIIPTVSSQKLPNGQMISKPLDDMFPFMTDEKKKCIDIN